MVRKELEGNKHEVHKAIWFVGQEVQQSRRETRFILSSNRNYWLEWPRVFHEIVQLNRRGFRIIEDSNSHFN